MSMTADASNHAISACLNQSQNSEVKPLAFFSRMLSETKRRYSTFDREFLAIFSAVKKWRDFVDGMPLTVYRDQKPIVGAFSNTKLLLSDRQQRQLSFNNEFDVDFVHISGKHKVVADTFSRHVTTISATANDVPVDLISIATEQEKDKDNYSHFTVFDIGSSKLYCEKKPAESSSSGANIAPPTHFQPFSQLEPSGDQSNNQDHRFAVLLELFEGRCQTLVPAMS